MAGYRQFHTKFWKDEWLIDLEPLERYLFCYLFTNDLSSISGIYKLPLKVIVNETGLEKEFIMVTLQKFQDAQKIFYKNGVMWVVNMKTYHKNASPHTMVKVNNDLLEIPNCDVKNAYLYYEKTGIYSIDTVSILNSESLSVSKSVSKSLNENTSEQEKELDTPLVSPVQRMIEVVTGLMPSNINDIKALDEITAMNPTQPDVKAAYDWYVGNGKKFRYYQSLVGPIKTAIASRIQSSHATKPAKEYEPAFQYKEPE